jgi:uncharacterized protein YkwD
MKLLLLLAIAVGLAAGQAAQSRETSGAALFTLSAAEFHQLPRAREPLEADALDLELLAAAVFHETNRIRQEHALPVLAFDADAAEAARLQSRVMAEDGEIRHENPGHEALRTLRDRVARVGMQPAFAGENVASAFLLRYESGEPFYTRRDNDTRVFSRSPGAAAIPPHTAVSFAEDLLERWMESPGHRDNILHTSPARLGTAAVPAQERGGMWLLYCTQVFYTPTN